MKSKSSLRALILAGPVAALLATQPGHAATLIWDITPGNGTITDGSGTWSDGTGNWYNAGDTVWANATPDSAIFGGGTLGAPGTVTLGSAITAGSLTFNTPNGGGAYTINTATFGLTLNTGITANVSATIQSGGGGSILLGANNAWSVAAAQTLGVSSLIAGTSALTKQDAGTLTLSGANTFSGQLTVQNGTLSSATINDDSADGTLGNNALAVILGNTGAQTGTLRYTGSTASSTKKFTLATGGTGAFDVTTGPTNLTLSGLINGSGALTKLGAGTLTLTSANTYTGATTVTGGTLQIGNNGTTGSLSPSSAVTTNATLAFNRTDTVTQGTDFAPTIGGSGGVTQAGSGTLVLNGTNTYTGATTVSAGTLSLTGSLAGTLILPAASTGTVNVGIGAQVVTADFSANAGTANATNALAITNQLKLAGGTTATLTGAASFTAAGANLVNNSTARTLSLSGGTLTLTGVSAPGAFVPLATIAATSSNNDYSNITKTTAWVGMRTGTQATPDKNALASNTYQNQWTPSAGNGWGKWDLDSTVTNASFNIANVFWWQYSQGGSPSRGITNAKVYYSNMTTDPGVPGDGNGNWTKFFDNTGGTAFPLSGGVNNHHVVVDLTGLSFAARWISILPTTPNPQDGNGIGSILFTQAAPVGTNLSATSVAATASSVLNLDSGAGTHNLAALNLTAGATTTVLSLKNGATLTLNGDAGNNALSATGSPGQTASILPDVTSPPSLIIAASKNVSVDPGVTLTVQSVISGGAVTSIGTGTLLLTGANTYTGNTTISAGTVIAQNASALGAGGTRNVSVAAGTRLDYAAVADSNLAITGTLGITGGAGTVIGGSIGSTSTGAQIAVTGAATISDAAHAVNIYGVTGITTGTTGTYTLIAGGGGSSLNPATVPTLGTVFNNTNFLINTTGGDGGTSAFVRTATTLGVAITSQAAIGTAFWTGGLSGATNVWAASDGTANSNWVTAVGGGATGVVPGAGANVSISATINTAPSATVLGASMSIGSLTIADTANGLGLNADGNTLTIATAAGITMIASVPSSTIAASVALGASQTWTNNSANTLTVSGAISGANNLTKDGTGTLVLSGANTYVSTTISAGTLQIGAGGGTGSLGSGGVVNDASLVFNRSSLLLVSNVISVSGSVTNAGTAGNTLDIGAINTYGGGTFINAGVLRLRTDLGGGATLGSGTVTVANGASYKIWAPIANVTLTNDIVLNGATGITGRPALNQDGGAGKVTLSGTVTLNATSDIGIGGVSTNDMDITGVISGVGGMIVDQRGLSAPSPSPAPIPSRAT